ncbi:MAG: hypothetical protein ACKVOK_08770 [Flavobacteriales bacterium]
MFQKLNYILIAAVAIAFTSCTRESSDSVDQDKIWVKYELEYDANEDVTKARAEFRFGGAFGTKLELSSPATIKFNGSAVPFNSTFAFYEKEIPGLVTEGTFVYQDVDGNTFTNDTPDMRSVAFPAGDITVVGGSDYVMPFVGTAISGGDIVTLVLNDKIFATSQSGATSITLGGVQTAEITAGPYIGYMYRTVSATPAMATGEGGLIWVTHKAANKAITVQ